MMTESEKWKKYTLTQTVKTFRPGWRGVLDHALAVVKGRPGPHLYGDVTISAYIMGEGRIGALQMGFRGAQRFAQVEEIPSTTSYISTGKKERAMENPDIIVSLNEVVDFLKSLVRHWDNSGEDTIDRKAIYTHGRKNLGTKPEIVITGTLYDVAKKIIERAKEAQYEAGTDDDEFDTGNTD